MKKILILVSLFSFLTIYSQTIKDGFYSTVKKDVGYTQEYFHFSNGNFRYLLFGCTGSFFGMGKYEIKNDSLVLAFEDFDYDSQKTKIDKIKSQSDFLKLDLKILDRDGGMPYTNFEVDGKAIGRSDLDGNFSKLIPKTAEPKILKISWYSYSPVEIKIEPGISEINGSVHLSSNYKFSQEDKRTFKIGRIGNSQIMFSKSRAVRYRKRSKQHIIKDLKKHTGNEDIDDYIKYF